MIVMRFFVFIAVYAVLLSGVFADALAQGDAISGAVVSGSVQVQDEAQSRSDIMQLFGRELLNTMKDTGKTASEVFDKDGDNKLRDVPDEYIEEAMLYNMACEGDPALHRYYDCQCLMVRYLDARIELGPEATRQSVAREVDGMCKDSTYLAGAQYEYCMGNPMSMGQAPDYKKFCECIGRSVARRYEQIKGRVYSAHQSSMRTAAILECQRKKY